MWGSVPWEGPAGSPQSAQGRPPPHKVPCSALLHRKAFCSIIKGDVWDRVDSGPPHTHPWGQQGGGRARPRAQACRILCPCLRPAPMTATASSAPRALEGAGWHTLGTPAGEESVPPGSIGTSTFLISPGLGRAPADLTHPLPASWAARPQQHGGSWAGSLGAPGAGLRGIPRPLHPTPSVSGSGVGGPPQTHLPPRAPDLSLLQSYF